MADEYLTAALYGMKRFNEGASKKVKELMGMEKLIELLNEYQYGMFVYEDDLLLLRIGSHVKVGGETFVINKKFGFIKWLVENEKIDVEKVKENGFITRTFDLDECGEPYSDLESLLMLLAIQDEPIEFLVSILK